jgi:hypothetical protein
MTRAASAAFLAALQDHVVRPALFFEGVFGAGTVRLWTGYAPITWAGQTWTGAGTLLAVSNIEETTEVVASGWTVTLSGIPADLLAAVSVDALQGDQGRLWLGLMDTSGALIIDPVLAASGRMDVPDVYDSEDECVITITYESRLIDLRRPREWRYTHESQQQIFPGDRGFEFVAGLQDKEITWGAGSAVGSALSQARVSVASKMAQNFATTGSIFAARKTDAQIREEQLAFNATKDWSSDR